MIDLKQYGYTETEMPPDGLIPGRVVEFRRNQYAIITQYGEVNAVLKGAFVHEAVVRADLPCVGDFVLLQHNESGDSRIVSLLPRHSKFSRADFSGHGYAHIKANREQVVATNFDYVFIMTSLNRDFRVNRILRYLTQARGSGGEPVIILTKADLCEDFTPQLSEVYEAAPDVSVHAISSYTGFGISELNAYLQPAKTIVFLGMSGIGKSSLLNVLANEHLMEVKQTRKEDTSKGSHTTTHRQLFMLPSGAMVIDTPGMRELGLYNAEEGISAGFSDVEELFAQCRFGDCRHQSEPGCAVQMALTSGELSSSRWEQYQKQQRENKYAEDKSTYLRDNAAWWKTSNKDYRAQLKIDRKNQQFGGKR